MPDSVHFEFISFDSLKSSIQQILNLLKACRFKEILYFFLSEEIASGAVTSDIEIILDTLSLFESQLSQIISSIISEHQKTARFEKLVHVSSHRLHLGWTDGGEHEDEGDDVEAVGGERSCRPLLVTGDVTHPGVTPAPRVLGVIPDQAHCRAGEVTAVDHQVRPGVHLQDRKHC